MGRTSKGDWGEKVAGRMMDEAYALALRHEHARAVRIVRAARHGMDPDYVGTPYASGWNEAIDYVLLTLQRGRTGGGKHDGLR